MLRPLNLGFPVSPIDIFSILCTNCSKFQTFVDTLELACRQGMCGPRCCRPLRLLSELLRPVTALESGTNREFHGTIVRQSIQFVFPWG
jgi:hypothetical protein